MTDLNNLRTNNLRTALRVATEILEAAQDRIEENGDTTGYEAVVAAYNTTYDALQAAQANQ